jgi:ribosomal protein S18 acetylase RimI-like enzyme
MEWQIRDYVPEDFESITVFWNEIGLGGSERKDAPEVILRSLKFDGKLYILENSRNKEIIGTSWLTCDGRRIHIHHFGVKENYRGKGFGKILAIESIKYAKNKGYQLRLDVEKNNTSAKKLYESFGFYAYTDYDIYVLRDIENIEL